LQKVYVEKKMQNNRQQFRCQFFLGFLVAFSGVSQRWELNKHYKNRAEIFLQNNDKKIRNRFFLISVSRFWAFLGEGSSKTRFKKYREKMDLALALVLFWPLTHPPTTGVADFFSWGRPLGWLGSSVDEIVPN
jgi:hypothetical protein